MAEYLLPLSLMFSVASGCEMEQDFDEFELDDARAKPALCAGEQCVDGARDMTLHFYLGGALEFPDKRFKPGAQLHLSGYETECWDSPCVDPAVFVRTLNSNKLLAAGFDADRGEGLSNPNHPLSSSLAPFTIDVAGVEGGVCPAVPDPYCGFESRATFDVSSGDDAHPGNARLVERTAAWAPGGYRISSGRMTVEAGGPNCEGSGSGSFSIIRDACDADDDCPEAEIADSCEQPQGPYDWVRARFPQWSGTYGRYEAHCEVMGLSYDTWFAYDVVNVELDCAFIVEPKRDWEDDEDEEDDED